MEAYAGVLLYAIPGFMGLLLIEWLYGKFVKDELHFDSMDTLASLTSGVTNTMKSILGLTIVIIGYEWVHGQIAMMSLADESWLYIVAFICIDFASYWNHRLNHHVNYFWNTHVVHHSSEEFNLACALRQSISNIFGIGGLFLVPAAILGVPPEVINIVAPLHLFAQFWYHTRYIGKLGILEYILVTPSQHRVHHAINPEYLDKNLAAIFCIWDRAFGTFQEEMDNVPCVYGVKRQPMTWNPFKINFQHLWLLIQDAWRTKSYWDKLRLWFMPTGWRPADVRDAYPVEIVEDPYNMEKYRPNISFGLKTWSWIQFVILNLFLGHMLFNIAEIPLSQLMWYSLFVAFQVYSFTALMDRDRWLIPFEIAKTLLGAFFLVNSPTWFGSGGVAPALVALYLAVSIVVVMYFYRKEVHHHRLDSSLA